MQIFVCHLLKQLFARKTGVFMLQFYHSFPIMSFPILWNWYLSFFRHIWGDNFNKTPSLKNTTYCKRLCLIHILDAQKPFLGTVIACMVIKWCLVHWEMFNTHVWKKRWWNKKLQMPIGLTVIKVNTWISCFVNNKSMPSQIIKQIPMGIFKQTLGRK